MEPAGALSIASLEKLKDRNIKNKNIVCILSGGNNDITRYPEFIEKNLVYLGIKHYFIINFSQKPGELKLFVNKILCDSDDLVRFEYIKKNNNNFGKALIGIELSDKNNLDIIISNLKKYKYIYTKVDHTDNKYGLNL